MLIITKISSQQAHRVGKKEEHINIKTHLQTTKVGRLEKCLRNGCICYGCSSWPQAMVAKMSTSSEVGAHILSWARAT